MSTIVDSMINSVDIMIDEDAVNDTINTVDKIIYSVDDFIFFSQWKQIEETTLAYVDKIITTVKLEPASQVQNEILDKIKKIRSKLKQLKKAQAKLKQAQAKLKQAKLKQ